MKAIIIMILASAIPFGISTQLRSGVHNHRAPQNSVEEVGMLAEALKRSLVPEPEPLVLEPEPVRKSVIGEALKRSLVLEPEPLVPEPEPVRKSVIGEEEMSLQEIARAYYQASKNSEEEKRLFAMLAKAKALKTPLKPERGRESVARTREEEQEEADLKRALKMSLESEKPEKAKKLNIAKICLAHYGISTENGQELSEELAGEIYESCADIIKTSKAVFVSELVGAVNIPDDTSPFQRALQYMVKSTREWAGQMELQSFVAIQPENTCLIIQNKPADEIREIHGKNGVEKVVVVTELTYNVLYQDPLAVRNSENFVVSYNDDDMAKAEDKCLKAGKDRIVRLHRINGDHYQAIIPEEVDDTTHYPSGLRYHVVDAGGAGDCFYLSLERYMNELLGDSTTMQQWRENISSSAYWKMRTRTAINNETIMFS